MRLTSGGDISLRNDNVSSRVACLCFVAASQITPQTSAGGEGPSSWDALASQAEVCYTVGR